MTNWTEPVTLEGNLVRLLPLSKDHRDGLIAAAADGNLWDLWFSTVPSETNIDQYIDIALNDLSRQKALPFVVVDKNTDKIIGSTRFLNIEAENRRLEIGYTWYAKSFQRTGVNTECKFLLLSHAFEVLNAIAVEFRTHWHNLPSRTAIARLGAKQDGVLRNHKILQDGLIRDTVVFSIIENEWPSVKQSLQFRMQRG